MNCPHCGVHVDEHPASDCFDLWIMKDVFGWTTSIKPYEGNFYPKGSYYVIWHQPDDFFPEACICVSQAFDKDGNNLRSTEDNPLGIWDEVPHKHSLAFSTSIAAAWEVVEKYLPHFRIENRHEDSDYTDKPGWHADFWLDSGHGCAEGCAIAPLAICRAAIKATKESE